jgi:phosphoribosylglycinamide formyltransferase-1
VAVLVSGGGTNLQAIIDKARAGGLPRARLALVVSSREGAYALERARAAGIPTECLAGAGVGAADTVAAEAAGAVAGAGIAVALGATGSAGAADASVAAGAAVAADAADAAVAADTADAEPAQDAALLALLRGRGIGLVVLAGYMRKLGPLVLRAYENRVINVHPSLIPAFCGQGCYGLEPHRRALAYGVKVTGATTHFVDGDYDAGPIILQKAVAVRPGDTPESLQRRVMQEAEWEILPESVRLFTEGRLRVSGRVVEIMA